VAELRDKLQRQDYAGAYTVLKRNPMMSITAQEARVLLNNLGKLVSDEEATKVDEEAFQKKLVETASYLYKRCARQSVLRGFGSVETDGYPMSSMNEISPQRLEEITGLPMVSLTPKRRGLYWQIAGISLCAGEYLLGNALGIDPLYTLIPGTMALFALDQLAFRGAYFETVYQRLVPEYKEKIIYHEAGHFLLAYLLGVPVRGVVTSAMDARLVGGLVWLGGGLAPPHSCLLSSPSSVSPLPSPPLPSSPTGNTPTSRAAQGPSSSTPSWPRKSTRAGSRAPPLTASA